MITRQQQTPRHNPIHGEYVRVAIADLELGNRYIYGMDPSVGEITDLDRPGAPEYGPARLGYRWVNGMQRERRSWRDVLVDSLTPAQRAAIVLTPGLCDGCDRTDSPVTASDDGRAQFCPDCLPVANAETT